MTIGNVVPRVSKGYKGVGMSGVIATWYAKNAQKWIQQYKTWAKLVSENTAAGDHVLEVAPGPGYLSIELAKLGKYKGAGLDISKTFVEIAQANAKAAGVEIEFRQGNASDMPYGDNIFDFVVCTSAFKNFSEPVQALKEMHRVLKPKGKGLIIDLRPDYSEQGMNDYLKTADFNPIDSLMTKWIFKFMLAKRAHSKDELKEFVSQTEFGKCEIRESPIGFELWLEK